VAQNSRDRIARLRRSFARIRVAFVLFLALCLLADLCWLLQILRLFALNMTPYNFASALEGTFLAAGGIPLSYVVEHVIVMVYASKWMPPD
jgi:hypothetical protein